MGAMLSCCAATACTCCVGLSCNICGAVFRIQKSEATRVWYAAIFIMFSLIAWVMNVWGYDMLSWIPWSVIENNCPKESCGIFSVYRLSFTLSLFHLILSVLLIGVKSSKDARCQFQDGWWPIKLPFLLIVSIVCFLIPNSLFEVYAWVSVFGAGLFLLLQLVLLIDFAHSWAESWIGKFEDDTENNAVWYWGLLICTGAMYTFVLGLSIVMFIFFSSNDQWYNPVVITLNMVAALIITLSSIHPRVQEANPRVGLLQASVVSSYCTYLIFSAILSQPRFAMDYDNVAGWTTVVIGAIFTIISVLYASLRAGSSDIVVISTSEKETLANSSDEEDFDDEKETTTYNFSTFHLVFALGSMYVGMLLTNWAIIDSSTSSVWTDMGWVSVGVKWACCATASILYMWTIFAPMLLPDRDFGF